MNCESLLFAITPTASSVLENGTIPLAQIARRVSPRIELGSDSITAYQVGYYKVSGTITFTVPTAGVATIELRKNGTPVAGITSSASVTTATTEVTTLPIEGIVRVLCGETAVLTLVNTGVAIDITNVALIVEKVA